MPEGHTETLQLTFILQLLAWYIKYQLTYSTVTYPPNCWHCIFNTNLHLYKCTLPQKPSILDSSHICCHDTADLNVQCTSYNVQCTTDIYSPYCDAFVHFTFHNNLKLDCIRYIKSWVTVEVNTSITPSNYSWSSDQPTMWSKNHHDSIHQSHLYVITENTMVNTSIISTSHIRNHQCQYINHINQ